MDQRSWQRASICLLRGCKILRFLNHYFITTVKRHTFTMPVWSSSFGVFFSNSCISCVLLSCQDVESYDPILNPVLNRELRRTGGRVLITIGDQDIDLSPSFTIFLSTRDPTVRKKYCSKLRTILYLASQTEKINIIKKEKKAATFLCPFWEVI